MLFRGTGWRSWRVLIAGVAVVGIPSGTVRSPLHHIRRRLRSHTTAWEEHAE
jgi:hypothetical protein